MPDFGWPELVALLTSVGFGVVSAMVPVVNAEAYVIVSQVSAVAGPVRSPSASAIGQTFGKLLLFLGVRRGKELPVHPAPAGRGARDGRSGRPEPGSGRSWPRLLDLVGQKRWGLPIVLLAAVVGIPPLYAVALLAGATTMRALWFALVVLVGRGHPVRAAGPRGRGRSAAGWIDV